MSRDTLHKLRIDFEQLDDIVGKGATLEDALRIVGLDENQIRKDLQIPDPVELTLIVISAGLAWKFGELGEKVEWLEGTTDSLIDDVTTGQELFDKLLKKLGYSLDKDGEIISTALVPALKAGYVGDDKSVYGELLKAEWSHDKIKKVLRIVQEFSDKEGIPNKVLLADMIRTYNERLDWLETQTKKNTESITKIMMPGEGNLNIPGRMRAVEDAVGGSNIRIDQVSQTVSDMQNKSFPKIGFGIGCVLGIVGGILWYNHDWNNVTNTVKSTLNNKVGKNSLTNTLHNEVPASWWWVAVIVGLGIVALVTGFAALLSGRKSKSTQITKSSSTYSQQWSNASQNGTGASKFQRFRDKRNDKKAEREHQRNIGVGIFDDSNSDPNNGKTEDLPAVGEEDQNQKKVNV